MLAEPLRLEMKASSAPLGENSGQPSVAGSVTSSRAAPPPAATVQMSPPETKADFRALGRDGGFGQGSFRVHSSA